MTNQTNQENTTMNETTDTPIPFAGPDNWLDTINTAAADHRRRESAAETERQRQYAAKQAAQGEVLRQALVDILRVKLDQELKKLGDLAALVNQPEDETEPEDDRPQTLIRRYTLEYVETETVDQEINEMWDKGYRIAFEAVVDHTHDPADRHDLVYIVRWELE